MNKAQLLPTNYVYRGETVGKQFKIGNIDAYAAEPTGKTVHEGKAILYLPDVISIWQNSKLMVDQYAANGYYTVMLDLFNGDAMTLNRPDGFDFMAWLTKGTGGNNPHTKEAVDPIVAEGIKFLQGKGYKKIGSVGYCFVSTFGKGKWDCAD